MDLPQLEAHLRQYPRSPLFARLALEYLSAGKTSEAIELCLRGLELYPSYSAAHLVLAKCYAGLMSFALALSSLETSKSQVSLFPLYDTLHDEWTSRLGTGPEKKPSVNAPAPVEPDITPPVTTEIHPPPVPTVPRDAQPDLSNEELQQIQRPPGSDSDEWRIVSKTLAEIFATQEEYDEAIITYRLLIQEQPEQKDTFQARIDELIKLREAKMVKENEQKSPGDAGLS